MMDGSGISTIFTSKVLAQYQCHTVTVLISREEEEKSKLQKLVVLNFEHLTPCKEVTSLEEHIQKWSPSSPNK